MEYLVFDIETQPLSEEHVLEVMGPFNPDTVKLGNRTDPDVIEAYIAEQEAEYLPRLMGTAALRAQLGELLVIGLLKREGESYKQMKILEGTEEQMLTAFWKTFQHSERTYRDMVCFNGVSFDLPFMLRRSWIKGIPAPTVFEKDRWPKQFIVDLRNKWLSGCSWGDKMAQSGNLNSLMRAFGLEDKGNTGDQFHVLWNSGNDADKAKAIEYIDRELEGIESLYLKMTKKPAGPVQKTLY